MEKNFDKFQSNYVVKKMIESIVEAIVLSGCIGKKVTILSLIEECTHRKINMTTITRAELEECLTRGFLRAHRN